MNQSYLKNNLKKKQKPKTNKQWTASPCNFPEVSGDAESNRACIHDINEKKKPTRYIYMKHFIPVLVLLCISLL